MLEIRPATRAEIAAWHGRLPPMTVRALAAVDERGEVQGVGGYYLAGNAAVVFTHHREGMRARDIVRGARAVLALARRSGLPIVAGVADAAGERAARHFGFAPDGNIWRLVA